MANNSYYLNFLFLFARPRASSSCDAISSLPTTTSLYGLKHSESLYGNYHAYLCDARAKVQACAASCANWVYPYDGETPPYEAFSVPSPAKRIESPSLRRSNDKQVSSNGDSDVLSSLETAHTGEFSSPQTQFERHTVNESDENSEENGVSHSLRADNNAYIREEKSQSSSCNDHSLPSVGESSGYESFAFKGSSDSSPENEPSDDTVATLDEGIPPSISENEVSKSSSPQFPVSRGLPDAKNIHEGSYMDAFKTAPSIGEYFIVLKVVSFVSVTDYYYSEFILQAPF